MKTIFDITDYGADNEGRIDSTAAIQRALDDAATCRGTVTVPPGTYQTGKLRMGKGVSLEGGIAAVSGTASSCSAITMMS